MRYICVSTFEMDLKEQLLITTNSKKQSKLFKDLASLLELKVEVVNNILLDKSCFNETSAFHSKAKHKRNPTILKHI